MGRLVVFMLCLLVLAVEVVAGVIPYQYRVQFIDPPSGMRIQYAYCNLNDKGQAIISATDTANYNHGYIWDRDKGLTDIGFLSGRSYTNPGHINEKGQVAGHSWSPSTTSYKPSRGFVWSPDGGMQELPVTPYGPGSAASINNSGVVVGDVTSPTTGQVLACSWSSTGQLKLLPSLGGTYGAAYDINDVGQITGFSCTASRHQVAVIWNSDGTIRNLGALPGYSDSRPFAINNKGQVVGYSSGGASGDRPLTLWNPDGTMVRLNSAGSGFDGCIDINDRGEVVGWWSEYNRSRPFYYSASTGVVQFSIPNLHISAVYGINNSGMVAGFGTDLSTSKSSFFLLEPVPEPSSLLTLTLGIAGSCGVVIRRRTRR